MRLKRKKAFNVLIAKKNSTRKSGRFQCILRTRYYQEVRSFMETSLQASSKFENE